MTVSGTVLSVDVERYGDTLTADTTATDTVLHVDDVLDFADEDDFAAGPQWLTIGDSLPMQYVSVDDDNDTVTLAAMTAVVYEAGEPVRMWDPVTGSHVVSHVAWIELDEAEDGDQPIPAEVRFDLLPYAGGENLAALIGARVVLEPDEDDGEAWYIAQVVGRQPVLDGTYIDPDTLPAGTSGQTFSTELPSDTEGYPEGHAWWQVVDGEVWGFWRLEAGAWLPQDIVTATALHASNALIDALQVVDLSTVNLQAVNIDGGSISIAQGSDGSLAETFTGTALPAGWTATLTDYDGDGAAAASVPGASVVATGPTGQTGSALLIDYGPTSSVEDIKGAGTVTTSLPAASDAELEIRFQCLTTVSFSDQDASAHLMLRQSGTPHGFDWSGIGLDLIPYLSINDTYELDLVSIINDNYSILGTITLPADPAGVWHRAKLRASGGILSAKVWPDADPEPEWQVTVQQAGVLEPGDSALTWRVFDTSGTAEGQRLWVDEWNLTTYAVGFVVNPDGTGDWPALRQETGALAASGAFAGSIKVVKFGQIVTAFGNISRATGSDSSFTATGITIPEGFRSPTTESLSAQPFYNSTASYRFRLNASGALEVQQSAANAQNMTLSATWFI